MNLAQAELIIIKASFNVLKPLQKKFGLSDDAIEGLCQNIATKATSELEVLESERLSYQKVFQEKVFRVTDGSYVDDKPLA